MQLEGKNIILTGASRGFGKYLAGRLWDEGANLLLIARTYDAIRVSIAEHKDSAYLNGDVSSEPMILGIMSWTAKHWNNIDGLINNAAIQGPIGPAVDTDVQEWQDTIVNDLFGPVQLSQYIARKMVWQGHGKIVNLSGGGAAGPRPNYSAYATAKAGLVRFSECLAEELKGTGIDVNCVAPGAMPTQMLPPGVHASPDAMREAADLCVFLLSDQSNGLTGKLISAHFDNWRRLTDPANINDVNLSDMYTLRRISDE